ncbi:MAG: ergothioneine biosynthesis protein EgtB [Burkholderiaceae bacterium]|nr:ergothioneine biosynthesis protein EgtB [Burkholderiaceae bacterium]
MPTLDLALPPHAHDTLLHHLLRTRADSVARIADLSDADCTVQSMPDASPAKWHLAHTTWFFEEFLLVPHLPGYAVFSPAFRYLFNSYYDTVGPRHPRPQRGLLTRPPLEQVLAYRAHIDAGLQRLPPGAVPAALLELGLHHEQQHQELLLTDLLHLFAQNPLHPAYRPPPAPQPAAAQPPSPHWVNCSGGLTEIGHTGTGFAFDNEGPRHRVWLDDYALAQRPVCNADWLDFIADDGYATPTLWLADGWRWVQEHGVRAPAYWQPHDDGFYTQTMSLHGLQPLQPQAPVTHVSFYEADAYARWAGARLPTEFEWEAAVGKHPLSAAVAPQFADHSWRVPIPAADTAPNALHGMWGGVWEWTASAYLPYPGFRPAPGAVGEYNGKFMSSQMVLRGGSCATPPGHVRASYRNFFYPHQRWQFTGLRLARA